LGQEATHLWFGPSRVSLWNGGGEPDHAILVG
jgi:hypothetical protein